MQTTPSLKARNRCLVQTLKLSLVSGLLASGCMAANAQTLVQVHDAWARATVAQQKATGAFMRLRADQGGRLVGVRTPVAEVAEIHEMKLEGDVMKMRAIPYLELPPGQEVELKPGGYHLMLMDLKQAVTAGSELELTLLLETTAGKQEQLLIRVPVRSLSAGHGAHHDKH